MERAASVTKEGEMPQRLARVVLASVLALVLPACQEDQLPPTSPALSATCEAQPSAGAAPLDVAFLVNVAGAEGSPQFAIGYGDGATGTNPDARHTYLEEGSYTAVFNVSTTSQSARCTTTVEVSGGASPRNGANQAPKAVFQTDPAAVGGTIVGKAPLSVHFEMCQTSDPEGDELYFLMDFDGDGTFDFKGITGFHCRADHTYAAGSYRPLLCVYDRDADRNPLHDDLCQVYTVAVTP
jgi:PKD repeat protein